MYDKLIEHVVSQRPELAPYTELFQNLTSANENNDHKFGKKQFRKLYNTAIVLEEDLEDAVSELDDLAMALGACEKCWGDNNRCSKCRGNGVTGYYMPDDKLFRQLVLPALKRLPWIGVVEEQSV